ncbi:MAG: lantibiotic dehydratase [Pseudonocardiaceae bacterium]
MQTAAIRRRITAVCIQNAKKGLETGEDLALIRIPPHLEVCVHLHAASAGALALGEFTARVLGVSRAAGTMTGRFLHLLDAVDQAQMAGVYAGLPTVDGAGVAVQLSLRWPDRPRRAPGAGRHRRRRAAAGHAGRCLG